MTEKVKDKHKSVGKGLSVSAGREAGEDNSLHQQDTVSLLVNSVTVEEFDLFS